MEKIKNLVKAHKREIFQFTLMTLFTVISQHVCSANETYSSQMYADGTMPWNNAFDVMSQQLTGPIPRWIGMIGIAASAIMLTVGDVGPLAKKVLFAVFGISIALNAPTIVGWMGSGGNTTGLLF